MKNFLKTIIFAFVLIALGSCEEENDPVVSANGFTLRAPDAPASVVLQPTNDADVVATLNWDKSSNIGAASVSTYKVEIAVSGTNFANAITANLGNDVTTADRTYVLTVGELNRLVNQLPGYACGVPMDVDIRVKSTLGAGFYNAFTQYSTNVITVNVTPYSSLLPTLAFSSDGIITDASGKLASSGVLNLDYEGYMYLTPGLYKFYKPDACGSYSAPTVYGDDNGGSFNTLVANGSGYQVITAGYYLVKADLGTSIYSVRPIIWNLYGSGKQTFPAANSLMAYQTDGTWKITINLANGYGFKFKSNGTALALGKFLPASVNTATYGGPDLSYVPPTGTITDNELPVPGAKTNPKTYVSYDVVLDLRTPRNYKYTITAAP